jgi:hypothetical protein
MEESLNTRTDRGTNMAQIRVHGVHNFKDLRVRIRRLPNTDLAGAGDRDKSQSEEAGKREHGAKRTRLSERQYVIVKHPGIKGKSVGRRW